MREPVRDVFNRFGLTKVASPLLDLLQSGVATLGSGLGMHMGANALFKLFSKTKAGHRFGVNQAATGLRHGMANKKINPVVSALANFGLGPESTAHYEAARMMGRKLKEQLGQQTDTALIGLREAIGQSPHISNAPIVGHIPEAVHGLANARTSVLDRLPTVDADAKTNWKQRLLLGGLAAGATAVEPHAALHMGINGTRQLVAHSALGKRFMQRGLQKGLEGQKIGPVRGALTDLVLSPAALDPQRIGLAANAELGSRAPQLAAQLPQVSALLKRDRT